MIAVVGDDLSLSERIEHAVSATEGVAEMHGGMVGEVVTYLPGRRVKGVRIHDAGVDVHVVLYLDVDITAVASQVQRVVSAIADRPATVVVEDVVNRR